MRENAQGDDAERAKASEHRCRPEIARNRRRQLAEISARKIVKNHCASKTALLRPRPQIAVRLAERGGMRDA